MDIKTKFSIGDMVFPISLTRKYLKEKCPVCEGNGEIEYKGSLYMCPSIHCRDGLVYVKEKSEYVTSKPFVVDKIEIEITEDTVDTSYMGSDEVSFYERNLFLSQKEAENKCIELNKENDYDSRRVY